MPDVESMRYCVECELGPAVVKIGSGWLCVKCAPPWTPGPGGDELPSAVFQALGAASMCWEPWPAGTFDSTKARWIGEGLLAWIEAHR
jgi:hypothetical protein